MQCGGQLRLCVDQLHRGVVFFYDVGSVGPACTGNECAGVGQSTEAAGCGRLFPVSVGNLAVVELAQKAAQKSWLGKRLK